MPCSVQKYYIYFAIKYILLKYIISMINTNF